MEKPDDETAEESEDKERPGPDATPAELAEWMEKDLWDSFAEGFENAGEDESDEETHSQN